MEMPDGKTVRYLELKKRHPGRKEALCSSNTEVYFSFEIQVCGLVESVSGFLVFALSYTR